MTYDEDDNNQKGDPSKILLPFSQSRVSTSSKNLKNVSNMVKLDVALQSIRIQMMQCGVINYDAIFHCYLEEFHHILYSDMFKLVIILHYMVLF